MAEIEKPEIIGLVGMLGSGKSTVREALEQKGFINVYFGGIVVDEVKRRGLEISEVNERSVREELRAGEGMAVMAIRSLPRIEELLTSGEKVVLDDLYSFAEYKLLKEKYADRFVTIAIVCPLKERYLRIAQRPFRPLNYEQATARDYAEIENIEKGGPIAIADYYLLNDGSLEDLNQQLEKLLPKIT